MPPNDLRCPVCLATWNQEVLMKIGIKSCPHCKTVIEPLLISQDGYIKINWQDLRVLAIYAWRWTQMFDRTRKGDVDAIIVFENILKHLSQYQPKDGAPIIPIQKAVPDPAIVAAIMGQLRKVEMLPKPKHPEPKVEMTFEIKQEDLKPNAEGKIPSPFIKKRNI